MSKSAEQYVKDAIRYYNVGRYEEALIACESAIQLDPACARAYHGKGLILMQQEKYEQALEAYQKASRLAPENAKLRADIGELFYIRRDYEKSHLSYERAIQLNGKFGIAYSKKTEELIEDAFFWYNQGRREEAIPAFEKVLIFNPGNAKASSYLFQLLNKPEDITSSSSYSGATQSSRIHLHHEATHNNQSNLSASVHPFNCRCPKCWEP